jgi:nucleoside-diphosphate-sugar epimerase
MKIVVIGGTGLIGSRTVAILRQRGHQVVAASPGAGSTRSPERGSTRPWRGRGSSWIWQIPLRSKTNTSEGNLLPAEEVAGVQHHVALSIVAIDRTDNVSALKSPKRN